MLGAILISLVIVAAALMWADLRETTIDADRADRDDGEEVGE